MQNPLTNAAEFWKKWPYKGRTYVALIIIIVILGSLIIFRSKPAQPTSEAQVVAPKVAVKTLKQISDDAAIDTVSSVELTNSAPLIARLGGRVTAVRADVGRTVYAGAVVVEIDGGHEANPTRVQAANAATSLSFFEEINTQTNASLNNAIKIAQNSLSAAKAGQSITASIQSKNRQLADTGVQQAQASLDKANDTGDDNLIQSANIGVHAAQITQAQAGLAAQLTNRQTSDAVKQATQGLAAAQIARLQTQATLASQKQGLQAQLQLASEQIRLMQVAAPITGEVARLSVHVGDFVHPGDVVGEMGGTGTARATIFVPQGAAAGLHVGQSVRVQVDGQKQQGTVSAIAARPSATTALWQVNISLNGNVLPHSSVHVLLPIHQQQAGTVFLPLDAINVREAGVILFTLDHDVVHEHVFTPIHYYGNFVEGSTDVPMDAAIVVTGNRTLHEGDKVSL